MKRSVIEWTVKELYAKRATITFPEYQREPKLWNEERRAQLVDSIFQDIDIPKLYFNRRERDIYEVIDGQQRLWAIWGFLDGTLRAGKANTFDALSAQDKRNFLDYRLQVTVLEDAAEDYLRLLFTRLQLGLLLNTGEKLNALTGSMKTFVFKTLATHDFLEALGIPRRRFAFETLCAQIAINSFSRSKAEVFSRTRYEDLSYFFSEYAKPNGADLDLFKSKQKGIPALFRALVDTLGSRSRLLKNRSYILSIYLLAEQLELPGLPAKTRDDFARFSLRFWTRLKEEAAKGLARSNPDLYEFENLLSSAPGEKYQIERRHQKLLEHFAYFQSKQKIKGDRS